MVRSLVAGAMLVAAASSVWSCRAQSKPNCDRMRACCAALRNVENGLPKEHEILCAHNPEYDEGCVDTVSDIVKFTPAKNLPDACKLQP
jgi:hypothetical protein